MQSYHDWKLEQLIKEADARDDSWTKNIISKVHDIFSKFKTELMATVPTPGFSQSDAGVSAAPVSQFTVGAFAPPFATPVADAPKPTSIKDKIKNLFRLSHTENDDPVVNEMTWESAQEMTKVIDRLESNLIKYLASQLPVMERSLQWATKVNQPLQGKPQPKPVAKSEPIKAKEEPTIKIVDKKKEKPEPKKAAQRSLFEPAPADAPKADSSDVEKSEPKYKKAWRMKQDGKSNKEIAAALGITEKRARDYVYKGKPKT